MAARPPAHQKERAIVYKPDASLPGLWSSRSLGNYFQPASMHAFLATRPNLCFQCHDLSLLPDVDIVPSEVVTGEVPKPNTRTHDGFAIPYLESAPKGTKSMSPGVGDRPAAHAKNSSAPPPHRPQSAPWADRPDMKPVVTSTSVQSFNPSYDHHMPVPRHALPSAKRSHTAPAAVSDCSSFTCPVLPRVDLPVSVDSIPVFIKETIASLVHKSAADEAETILRCVEPQTWTCRMSPLTESCGRGGVRTLEGLLTSCTSRDDLKRKRLNSASEYCEGANDRPLDLTKKRHVGYDSTSATTAVTLAKKIWHPVTSRVSECLLQCMQKASGVMESLGITSERDRANIVFSSWHRLLLWLLAENDFSFVVTPVGSSAPAAVAAVSSASEASGASGVLAEPGSAFGRESISSSGSGRDVPTAAFAQAITAFIAKCYNLKLDKTELDLLFSITLLHSDEHHASGAVTDQLIGDTKRRLMDDLLRHTTESQRGGVGRYSQLLLCLPPLYAVDMQTFEVLFCKHLTERVDMRLLLLEIMKSI